MLTCWLCLAWIYMFVCTFYAPMPISESSHACMLGFMSFHVYVLNFNMLHVSMLVCLYLCFHMLVCLDLCYLPCVRALHAMFVCLGLGYVCHAMCYCSPFVTLSFFLAFWPIGSDPIYTLWSLPLFAHLGPCQRVWIILICISMLACFYALCPC